MIRSELFKITRHRTPWALGAVYCLMVLAGPIYFLFKQPADNIDYLKVVTSVFPVAGLLLGPIFGAWLFGNEYRNGTIRRVLAIDARRGRLLATKASLGLVMLVLGLVAIAGIGFVGAAGAAAVHGDSLVTDNVLRLFLGGGFMAAVSVALAFALSVVLRSDTYAMLSTLAVMAVLGQMLAAIPKVGKYTPYAVSQQIFDRIQDSNATGMLSLSTASLTLALIVALPTVSASWLFATRDV